MVVDIDYINTVLMQATARVSDIIAGIICGYKLEAKGYTVSMADDGKTGRCRILGVHYDVNLQYDIYDLRDVDTGEEFSVSQVEIWFKNI